jgi:hypothetical protein
VGVIGLPERTLSPRSFRTGRRSVLGTTLEYCTNAANPVVRQDRKDPKRTFALPRWGLILFWAKDPSIGFKTINAMSDTAAEKPADRMAALGVVLEAILSAKSAECRLSADRRQSCGLKLTALE